MKICIKFTGSYMDFFIISFLWLIRSSLSKKDVKIGAMLNIKNIWCKMMVCHQDQRGLMVVVVAKMESNVRNYIKIKMMCIRLKGPFDCRSFLLWGVYVGVGLWVVCDGRSSLITSPRTFLNELFPCTFFFAILILDGEVMKREF
jgi:hypothetical protein